MPDDKATQSDQRLIKLADRLGILMCVYWSRFGDFDPLDDDYFWNSSACDEIRAMPEYQEAIQHIREML